MSHLFVSCAGSSCASTALFTPFSQIRKIPKSTWWNDVVHTFGSDYSCARLSVAAPLVAQKAAAIILLEMFSRYALKRGDICEEAYKGFWYSL